jgi:hypothetical protein
MRLKNDNARVRETRALAEALVATTKQSEVIPHHA